MRTDEQLRRFGLMVGGVLGLLGALLLWRGRPAGPYMLGLGLLFLLSAGLAPRLLGPVERAWMALARVLSVVMTYVILTLTFYLVLTPYGLLLRLLRRDLLRLRFDPRAGSYWTPVEPEGPSHRPDRPY